MARRQVKAQTRLKLEFYSLTDSLKVYQNFIQSKITEEFFCVEFEFFLGMLKMQKIEESIDLETASIITIPQIAACSEIH